jgi:hypothetical protein
MSSEGKPKMPPPMMQLMTRAVIVQRPIARTKGTPHPAIDRHSVAPNNYQRSPPYKGLKTRLHCSRIGAENFTTAGVS